jgi:hypothetical protein
MDKALQQLFESYPDPARDRMLELRQLIHAVADEHQLGEIEESLKWGEASFSSNTGSPVRIDWKARQPQVCFLYFHCQTRLLETFRELYGDSLQYQANRAIVLPLEGPLPEQILKHCLYLALNYHKLKRQPLLGA